MVTALSPRCQPVLLPALARAGLFAEALVLAQTLQAQGPAGEEAALARLGGHREVGVITCVGSAVRQPLRCALGCCGRL